MTYIPNSIEARDVASLVHMQTNLRRHQQEGPHVIVRGEGCRMFDDSGRDYIEAVAGLWCASLGFGSERLAKVAYEQMRTLGYYHLYRHRSHEPAIALAETLLKIAPVPMARVVFQCSGSEANDTAIKLAWYYWNAVGEPQRTKIIARRMAYHGNTARRRQPVGKAGHACRLRPAARAVQAHRISPLLPPSRAGRDRARVFGPHGRGARDSHPGGRARHHRRLFRGACHGRRRGDCSAGGLFREGPGGPAPARYSLRRRRGDLRLCAHRRNVGLADLRHPARHGDFGQGAVRRHAADLGRPRQRANPRGDARAVGHVRQFCAWLYLCGPPRGRRGRARGAEDLRRDRHRRPRHGALARCCSRRSAGLRRIRWSATCAGWASLSAWS